MPVSRAYKVRMFPDPEQEKILSMIVNATRGLRNFSVKELKAASCHAQLFDEKPERMSIWELHRADILPDWAEESVPSTVINAESQKHAAALKNFFDSVSGRRKGAPMGLPATKSRYGRQSFSFQRTIQSITDTHVYLPTSRRWGDSERQAIKRGIRIAEPIGKRIRAGAIRTTGTKKDGSDSGKPRQYMCTISVEGGWWYFSVGIVNHHPPAPRRKGSATLGIDARCAAYVCSDGVRYNIPPRLLELEARLPALNQALSAKQVGSRNRRDARIKLSRLHARIARIRKDWIEKVTHDIVLRASVIMIEDLQVKSLTKREGGSKARLNRMILRASFRMFRTRLEQKAEWYGSQVVVVNPAYSSRKCSECGHINNSRVTDKTYTCSSCGLVTDRYLNAAKNIAAAGGGLVSASSGGTEEGDDHASTADRSPSK